MGMIRSLAVLALGAGYATAQDVTAGPSVTDVGEYFMRMPLSVVYDKASDTLSVDMPKANLEELMGMLNPPAQCQGPAPFYEREMEIPSAAHHIPGFPFDHVSVDLNICGHPPFGDGPGTGQGYGVPHFDFHFYTISDESRSKAKCTTFPVPPCPEDETSSAIFQFPPRSLLPKGYTVDIVAGVPTQGMHWVDETKEPYQPGQMWGQTESAGFSIVIGTLDGQISFLEPMVSFEHMATRDASEQEVPTPMRITPIAANDLATWPAYAGFVKTDAAYSTYFRDFAKNLQDHSPSGKTSNEYIDAFIPGCGKTISLPKGKTQKMFGKADYQPGAGTSTCDI